MRGGHAGDGTGADNDDLTDVEEREPPLLLQLMMYDNYRDWEGIDQLFEN